MPELEIETGDDHEHQANGQALVRHVGGKQDARQREIDDGADRQQQPSRQVEADDAVTHRPGEGERRNAGEDEGDGVVIDIEHEDEAVDLAGRLPGEFVHEAHGGACQEKRDRRQERQAACAKIGEPRKERLLALDPEPLQLEGEDPDPEEADREQMAKEQHDHEDGRHAETDVPRAFAQRDPGRKRPKCHADTEKIIHHADEQDGIVEKRRRGQGQRRPAAGQRTIEREGARKNDHENRNQEKLPRVVDVDHTREHGDDDVHHEIRYDLPLNLVELGEVGIGINGVDDVHPRQMVHVVGERRQPVGKHRNRDGADQKREQRQNVRGPKVSVTAGKMGGGLRKQHDANFLKRRAHSDDASELSFRDGAEPLEDGHPALLAACPRCSRIFLSLTAFYFLFRSLHIASRRLRLNAK